MEVEFADPELDRLEVDPRYSGGFTQAIVKSYRKKMQFIRAVHDERDFYSVRGLHFEKLKGARSHQYSMRLNDQWRLIIELKGEGQNRKVLIVGIEDYH